MLHNMHVKYDNCRFLLTVFHALFNFYQDQIPVLEQLYFVALQDLPQLATYWCIGKCGAKDQTRGWS